MIPPFDIFKIEPRGDVRWLQSATDIDVAKARLKVLGSATPGNYIVFSQKTGQRMVFTVDGSGELTETTGG